MQLLVDSSTRLHLSVDEFASMVAVCTVCSGGAASAAVAGLPSVAPLSLLLGVLQPIPLGVGVILTAFCTRCAPELTTSLRFQSEESERHSVASMPEVQPGSMEGVRGVQHDDLPMPHQVLLSLWQGTVA